jgi:selenocysteine lyase/cysteine desulfurase
MRGAGIDLLCVAGHKGMLGIQGSGALLFSERVNPEPILYGGTGSISLSLDMPDFYPDRLEAGTLSFPAILSLLEGVRYLTLHQKEIEAKLLSLSGYLLSELSALPEYTAFSLPNPWGIVSFRHRHIQSEYIADILSSKYDICVRGGLHCAPLMHEALGTLDGGLVRVSFSNYNAKREIDRLIFALSEIANS